MRIQILAYEEFYFSSFLTDTEDIIQTVLRRFELKSCTSLMDEQSNPS